MLTAWETFPIKFKGGWRTDLGRLEHGLHAPGSAAILQNYEPSVRGGYAKILGYSKLSETEVTGSGQIIGVVATSESGCLARRGDDWYFSNGAGWTSKGTVVTSGAIRTSHDRYNFDGNDKIVIVDGYEDPALYDINTATLTFDTSAPADVTGAQLVKVHSDHIFFAKDNLLSFTAPYTDDDYNTGNGAGTINIGDDITEMIVFREQLIIFTENSIYRLEGNRAADFTLQTIAKDTGCLFAHTAAEVGGDIMYLGPDGIRWLSATERNNDFGLDRASEAIQSEVTAAISNSTVYNAVVVRNKSQYRLFTFKSGVPASSSTGFLGTKFSGQDVSEIEWAHVVGMKVYSADSHQFPVGERIIFSSDDDYVYVMESGNSFDGTDIRSIFQTPFMPINDPRVRKTYYKHSLYMTTTGSFDITCSNRLDYLETGIIQPPSWIVSSTGAEGVVYGSPSAIYGTSRFQKPTQTIFINNILGSSYTIALRYDEESSNPIHILDYAVLEYRTNERR